MELKGIGPTTASALSPVLAMHMILKTGANWQPGWG
jgi:hypothetical protein